MSEKENLVLNSTLIYCEPMKRFQNRNDTMTCLSSGDGTGSRIVNKLKTVSLSSSKIEQTRAAIVHFAGI